MGKTKLISKFEKGGYSRKNQNITPIAPELQSDGGYHYQPLRNGGSKAIYEEQKWLYEHGFYNGVSGNKGAKEVDGLLGEKTKAARQAAIKAGYTRDQGGKYTKPFKVKLRNKTITYDTMYGPLRTTEINRQVQNTKAAKTIKQAQFVNSPKSHVKTKDFDIPKNDSTYNMLLERESKKSKPNRWAYLDKTTGNIIIHNGITPVYQSKIIAGLNKGDAAISWAGTDYHGDYNYLRANNIQTSPAGILVIQKSREDSPYGVRDYNSNKRYETRLDEEGNYYLDESGNKKIFRTGEPMYNLKFAGSNSGMANAFHSTPQSSSQGQFDNNMKRASSGCFRFPNNSLRYIYDEGLLQENDTIFSKPEMEKNYLYVDDNNKVQMHVGDSTNYNPILSRYQQEY